MIQAASTIEKKERGLLSTKEFSEISGVAPSALRYWDNLALLCPAYSNLANGHRYYSPDQVAAVQLIKVMGSLGISLNTMKDAVNGWSPERMLELCLDYGEQLEGKISELRAMQDLLRRNASRMEESKATQSDEITLCALPAQPFRRIDLIGGRPAVRVGRASGPVGYAYNELYDLLEEPDHPAHLILYDPRGPEIRPAGEFLVGTQASRYGKTSGLPRRMLEHALRHSLEMQGPAYAVNLPNADGARGAEQYLMQIAVGVRRNEEIGTQ